MKIFIIVGSIGLILTGAENMADKKRFAVCKSLITEQERIIEILQVKNRLLKEREEKARQIIKDGLESKQTLIFRLEKLQEENNYLRISDRRRKNNEIVKNIFAYVGVPAGMFLGGGIGYGIARINK